MKKLKQFNECTDVEKRILREYTEWCKSTAPAGLKYMEATKWRKRAEQARISHLLQR